MLKLIPVDLKAKDLSIALTEATKNSSATEGGEEQYLCRKGSSLFVSGVSLTTIVSSMMKKNCDKGCIWVDWVRRKMCVPIHELDELFYIEGGDYM